MKSNLDLTKSLLDCWRTAHQTSVYLIKIVPANLWNRPIPGYKRKTVGQLAIHLHNSRCMWIKSIAGSKFNKRLTPVNYHHGTRKEVLTEMRKSAMEMLTLLESCVANGGRLPARPAWLNFPNDVVHLVAYFVAHEAHHRGQITMALRQFGHPLSRELSGGLWQWTKLQHQHKKVKR